MRPPGEREAASARAVSERAAERRPLTDMQPGETYLGFEGGLYPGGANVPPPCHHTEGRACARAVVPLDGAGRLSPCGRIGVLSIGFSNTSQEFCGHDEATGTCSPWSFAGRAAADPSVEHDAVALVDGAFHGRPADAWTAPHLPEYDRIRDESLAAAGLTEAQVQVAWVKVNNRAPAASLPDPDAEAFRLVGQYGALLRAARVRYPSLRQAFFSSRLYAGYARVGLHPEPWAYESGFGVKWTIEAQIRQMETGQVDTRAGSLGYDGAAPWAAWGPYLWANGEEPRADGLTWEASDFREDGTHPARGAEAKVGARLLDFFKTSPYTRDWFLAEKPGGRSVPERRSHRG